MSTDDLKELRDLCMSTAKTVQSLANTVAAQRSDMEDVLTALDLIGRARDFQEERIELDRRIEVLLMEILQEVRSNGSN